MKETNNVPEPIDPAKEVPMEEPAEEAKAVPARRRKTLLYDGLLILAFLLAALAAWRFLGPKQEEGAVVRVQIEGREDAYYPLSRNGVYPLNDGTNTLVIEDGWAWMRDADCPDKLCVYQGKIRKNGQWIICLPNRVAVTIEGAEEDAEWDEILG